MKLSFHFSHAIIYLFSIDWVWGGSAWLTSVFQVHIFLFIMIVLFSTTLIECPAEFVAAEVQMAAGDAPTEFGSCVVVFFLGLICTTGRELQLGLKGDVIHNSEGCKCGYNRLMC